MFFTKKSDEPVYNRNVSSPNLHAPRANEAFQQNAHAAINRNISDAPKSSMAVRQKPHAKMATSPASTAPKGLQRTSIPTYGNPHKSAAPRDLRDGRKLIVGREISLNGEINTCDHLVVEGTVRATIKEGQTLEIAHRGLFEGTVEINEATIAGTFEGNIRVLDRLYVKSTGVIRGTIEYGEMEVEAGARIDGQIVSMGVSASSNAPANDEMDEQYETSEQHSQEQDTEMDKFAMA